jgi:hypothetical protein
MEDIWLKNSSVFERQLSMALEAGARKISSIRNLEKSVFSMLLQ